MSIEQKTPLFPNQPEYMFPNILADYVKKYPKLGYIKFKVYEKCETNDLIPISKARVTVNKYLGEGYYTSKIEFTDSNGETEAIPFLTIDGSVSMIPGYKYPYEIYNAHIESPDHIPVDVFNIQVFDGITQTYTVILDPKENICLFFK